MKKLTILAGVALLLSLSACGHKGLCPAYGSAKPTKPAATRPA